MTFGERPQGRATVPEPVKVGDTVKVTAGRYRGSRAVVVAVDDAELPGGGGVVRVALIRRPRAGESWEFIHLLERIEP